MSNPPQKYTKINGVRRLNPEYEQWEKAQGGGSSLAQPSKALPVVSNMKDFETMCNNLDGYKTGKEIRLAEAIDGDGATLDMLQRDDVCSRVGVRADKLLDELGKVFAEFEIPMGMMNKLTDLSPDFFDSLEFLLDDSGSMNSETDTVNPQTKRNYSRWEEVIIRLKAMLKVLAYIPTPPIKIWFLNRSNIVNLNHNGQDPVVFLNDAYKQLDDIFRTVPKSTDLTPFYERLKQSFDNGKGKRTSRYFFGDGEPTGGRAAEERIKDLVVNRGQHGFRPEENPLTLLSCTDNDEQVQWMKDLEEIAPYCAELDDYHDEYDEVVGDQGVALPFTKGFHLICSLVAAMNPDDLDALDESVPLTKFTLDNLMGVQNSNEDYKYYFDEFLVAQSKKNGNDPKERYVREFNWRAYYNDFLVAPQSKSIPVVGQFKAKLDEIYRAGMRQMRQL